MTRYQTPDQRRASAVKRKASAAKPGAPFTVETPQGPVTLTKMPMEWDHPHGWDYDYRKREIERAEKRGEDTSAMVPATPGDPDGPKFKSKYKAEFAGVVRGYIIAINGWGKPWVLYRAIREDTSGYYQETPRNEWWHDYASGHEIGHFPICAAARTSDAGGRDALAALIPQLVEAGELPTVAEAEQKIRQVRAERKERKRAEAREWAEHHRQHAAKQAEASNTLGEEADALEQIADAHRQTLSNYQLSVLLGCAKEKRDAANAAASRAADHKGKAEIQEGHADA